MILPIEWECISSFVPIENYVAEINRLCRLERRYTELTSERVRNVSAHRPYNW